MLFHQLLKGFMFRPSRSHMATPIGMYNGHTTYVNFVQQLPGQYCTTRTSGTTAKVMLSSSDLLSQNSSFCSNLRPRLEYVARHSHSGSLQKLQKTMQLRFDLGNLSTSASCMQPHMYLRQSHANGPTDSTLF